MNFGFKMGSKTGSIGIIGGADGPASVIISKSDGVSPLVKPAAALLAFGTLFAIFSAKAGSKKLFALGSIAGAVGGALLALGAVLSNVE